MEAVGGLLLEDLSPTPMASGALASVEARLDERSQEAKATAPVPMGADDMPGLPPFVRRYTFAPWKWIAPRVHLRSILLPEASATRAFLLKSAPRTKMLEHAHAGIEMTCVLSGSFSHEGGRYGPGDFDLGDETIEHQVLVGEDEDCICLVAMQGKLRFNGLIGRIIQPLLQM
jgi:putative transcriptional regulator